MPTTTTPLAAVVIDLGAAQAAKPGDAVTVKAAVKVNNASTIQSYKWTQTAGPKATLSGDTTDTLKATLADVKTVKAELLKGVRQENRFQVQAINPHALIVAETSTFEVAVTTSSGVYKKTVNVVSTIPFAITTGLQDVPKGVPVLLSGKTQDSYNWTVTGPVGTKAAITDATDRFPSFTPDVVGKYTLTETVSKATVDIFAGTWAGAITGVDANGRPVTGECSLCHNGSIAPDKFTNWKKTGHAEILTDNLNNPAGHWSAACAECHTVGYNTAVDNGGFDEAMKAENWIVPASGAVGYWKDVMLAKFPKTAKLGNIQCDNCHGPSTDATLHVNGKLDAARISIASEVCGSCHGEPLRHGRYQQWEESGHAGLSGTTPERGVGNAHCGRCHSGQGFLAWLKQGDLTKQIQGANGNATAAELAALGLTTDAIQPITCSVCHDPHDIGTVTGEPTDANRANSAKVRVMQATAMLPAGFQAKDVGKGALCITCHNTRNAVHGDEIAISSYSAPHTAAQGDVLMGQNAYFAEGIRSPHASLIDTCVTCHMEATPPPAEFSYQLGGTNHDFSASIKICAQCHSALFNGAAFQSGIADKEHELAEAMGKYFLSKIPAQITVKDYTPHTNQGVSIDVLSGAVVISKDNIASAAPTEPHGQQGFILKLKAPVNVTYTPATGQTWAAHTVSMTELEVRLGDVTTNGTTVVFPFTDTLVKAGWNFFLIEGDGSKGIHNPAFTIEVINSTIAALD